MPAPTFTPPRPPTIGAVRRFAPRVWAAEFGDGYSQRTSAGLNAQPQEWNLEWSPINAEDGDAIVAFLDARRGVEPFRWQPPRESATRVFICQQYTLTELGAGRVAISAVFREVFDLGA